MVFAFRWELIRQPVSSLFGRGYFGCGGSRLPPLSQERDIHWHNPVKASRSQDLQLCVLAPAGSARGGGLGDGLAGLGPSPGPGDDAIRAPEVGRRKVTLIVVRCDKKPYN